MNIANDIWVLAAALLPSFTEDNTSLLHSDQQSGWDALGTGGGIDYVWGRFGTTEIILSDHEDTGTPYDPELEDQCDAPCTVIVFEGVEEAADWNEETKFTEFPFTSVSEALLRMADHDWAAQPTAAAFAESLSAARRMH